MAKIRAYTTIEQSRKLAEILPLESADMIYTMVNGRCTPFIRIETIEEMDEDDVLCWSLAALLDVVPEEISLNSFKNKNWNAMVQQNGKVIYSDADNPIDACYELILKLNELNLL